MFMGDICEKKYEEVFENVYSNLKDQKNNDDNFNLNDLKKLLDSLYDGHGSDWLGRGELQDSINNATICACEALLEEWEEEEKNL